MKFFLQQQILLWVSAQLLVTPMPAVASSFVTPKTSATKPSAFLNKNGRYNPLVHVSPGGDDSAIPEGGAEPAPVEPAPIAEPVAEVVAPPTAFLGPNAKSPPGFLRSKFPGLPWHKLPDYLTYARCLAIPAFVALFYSKMNGNSHIYTGTIFALASATDWLDGFLARRWDVSTACEYISGKFAIHRVRPCADASIRLDLFVQNCMLC